MLELGQGIRRIVPDAGAVYRQEYSNFKPTGTVLCWGSEGKGLLLIFRKIMGSSKLSLKKFIRYISTIVRYFYI